MVRLRLNDVCQKVRVWFMNSAASMETHIVNSIDTISRFKFKSNPSKSYLFHASLDKQSPHTKWASEKCNATTKAFEHHEIIWIRFFSLLFLQWISFSLPQYNVADAAKKEHLNSSKKNGEYKNLINKLKPCQIRGSWIVLSAIHYNHLQRCWIFFECNYFIGTFV